MPQGSQLAPLTGGSRGLGRHRQLPKATVGQVRRPGSKDALWGCDYTHCLSQGHARREEILKAEAGVGKVPCASLFRTPFCPQRGTFVPRVPVLEVETVPPKELRPTLVSRVPGSPLPESPTTCEMWVGLGTGWCWGPLQVEGSCTPGS